MSAVSEQLAVLDVTAKVRRYLHEGRVQPEGCAAVIYVDGDTGRYRVILGEDFTSCSCPALRERCSHVCAAILQQAALEDERDRAHLLKLTGASS